MALVSPILIVSYLSADFSNMAQSAAIITYLVLIGAVFPEFGVCLLGNLGMV